MVRTTTYNYEVSQESGRERMLPVPYTRLEDQTPTLHDPAAVLSLVPGTQVTGTSVSLNATDLISVLNVADGAVFYHNVRNVRTYAAPHVHTEATFGAINIGDPVYYDRSTTMPASTYLSMSPFDNSDAGAANPLFGHVVMDQDETAASFPKGTDQVGSTHECAVMQV